MPYTLSLKISQHTTEQITPFEQEFYCIVSRDTVSWTLPAVVGYIVSVNFNMRTSDVVTNS